MTIEFSNKFKEQHALKSKYYIKIGIYNYINQLEEGRLSGASYRLFQDELKAYIKENSCVEFFNSYASRFGTYLDMALYSEQIDSLLDLFKSVKNSAFISNGDKQLVEAYVGKTLGIGNEATHLLNAPEQLLEKKLGNAFVKWSDEWKEDSTAISICNIKNEIIANLDKSPKYDEKTIECFLEAANAEDFVEAVSQCQYVMHDIGVLGETSQYL